METAEIRRRFLDFFAQRDHTLVPSSPLVHDDPNLLFVNAGMVPFKPYFLGQQSPPYPRAVSVQKCVRTLDIEEVGRTTRHGTFFQMNGNFSFGDYFKERAVELAWELVTGSPSDGGLGFSPDQIWPTVYLDDDEAFLHWRRVSGLPAERIQRRGKKDNTWDMGVPGPAGPCSEIFVDRGPKYGPEGGPIVDEERFLEIWNLVFMQYERGAATGPEKGDYEVRGDLPSKNIDTGMGLERVAYVLQGVDNIFEIDEVFPVLARAAELAGRRYGADHRDDVRLRVVADHVRSALMLVGDGVTPSNEARGYVVRRLLRRAVRSMRLLGVDEPVLGELLAVSRDCMQASYPELAADYGRIAQVVAAEEEAFRATLRAGTQIFDTAVVAARSQGSASLSGGDAFRLHDTYGFPIDLTLEMAAEAGVSVDEVGFRQLMTEQRERAKADARAKRSGHGDVSSYRAVSDDLGRAVEFTGYDEVSSEASVAGLLVGGVATPSAAEGDEVEVVLDRTPFYAEAGGQLADTGRLDLDGAVLDVLDVQSPLPGLVVHRARVVSGEVRAGALAHASVDVERRRAISRAHTATHMVHKAFREALGDTARQAGAENAPGRFRFDLTTGQPIPSTVVRDVEDRVNALLAEDLPVHAEVMSLDEARRSGAMALFGEKYGDEVRVVSVGEWARELCGGTHAQRSGQLGLVTLLGESSIGAGVRRVEALVGVDAYRHLAREHVVLAQVGAALKARPADIPERVATLLERLRTAERELERVRAGALLGSAAGLAAAARDLDGVGYVAHREPAGATADDLRRLAVEVRALLPAERPGVVVIAGVANERPLLVVAVNDRGRQADLRAGELVRLGAQVLGGGGGGKDDVAQGGGSDPARLDEALARVADAVAELGRRRNSAE